MHSAIASVGHIVSHSQIQSFLMFINDFEGLPIVVEQHHAEIAVFFLVPLLKVHINKYALMVSSGISFNTCYLI